MSETLPEASPEAVAPAQIAKVRSFNRLYTRVIGVLRPGLNGSRYSLAETRVLYELNQQADGAGGDPGAGTDGATGIDGALLRRSLDLDTGYFSRVLGKLTNEGLVSKARSPDDGRRQLIRLTARGHETFAELDQLQVRAVQRLLAPLTGPGRAELVGAMDTIHGLLHGPTRPRAVTLRPPLPGDLGWVVHRNGALYSEEYGWNEEYEAVVARIAADYAAGHDPRRETGWIAERAGRPAGAVFCMTADERTARLRLLHVEPSARNAGIGSSLVEECLRFATDAGYQRITLWTVSVLEPARRIYQRAGFTLDDEAPLHAYGHCLTQQNWSRGL